MALQAGTTRVYGVEVNPEALEVATAIIRGHGYGEDRFKPLLGLPTTLVLPE